MRRPKTSQIILLLGVIILLVACAKTTEKLPPKADFTAENKIGKAPLEVKFIDHSEGSPENWLWDFGDGSYNNDQNPHHTYTLEGYHTVSLQVTNEDGHDVLEKPDLILIDNSLGEPCPDIASFIYDGQTYNTVQIGSQCWMKENLNIGTKLSLHEDQTDNQVIEKHCYQDLEDKCDLYGGFYQWDELMGYQEMDGTIGICPAEWHIPSLSEWNELINYLGGTEVAGERMKMPGESYWFFNSGAATNESNFSALPAGRYHYHMGWFPPGLTAYFWTSTKSEAPYIKMVYLADGKPDIIIGITKPEYGYSVRCIKD